MVDFYLHFIIVEIQNEIQVDVKDILKSKYLKFRNTPYKRTYSWENFDLAI